MSDPMMMDAMNQLETDRCVPSGQLVERPNLSAHTFEALLESAPDAIIIVDAEGCITIVNSQAEILFGYSRDELIGATVDGLLPVHLRRIHAHHRASYMADPRTRPMGKHLDLIAERRDGSQFPAEISLSPLHSSSGTLVTAVIRDLTERKQAEEQRNELQREQEARARAEDAVREREEFLSIAAHELKTPLTAVKASAQFLDRLIELRDSDTERLEKLSAQVVGQINRMESLVGDLLDVSRIQQGRMTLRQEQVDMVAIVRQVMVRFAHNPLKTDAHDLTIDAHAPVIGVWDSERIDQVLTNLISNALKYSPNGGQVRVTVSHIGDVVEVRVSDEGIGIASDEMERVFEPFQRGTGTRGRIEGTGLGLFISRQIVERHGGRLQLHSTLGGGTTVNVVLPLNPTTGADRTNSTTT